SHLNQIHMVAEQWKNSVKVNFPSGDFHLRIEEDDLFEGLKEHFPSSILWENYKDWKEKAEKYKNLWGKLIDEGNGQAEQETGLKETVVFTQGLASNYVSSALWYTINLRHELMEIETETPEGSIDKEYPTSSEQLYKKRSIHASCPIALEFVPDRLDIAWGTEESVSKYIGVHYKIVEEFWSKPEIIDLVNHRESLVDLQSKIDHELRLSILRKSYISYVCEFCPARMLAMDTL
ncbi:hypothetical protein ACFLT3_02200, partial [Chloroflexota bacterium]